MKMKALMLITAIVAIFICSSFEINAQNIFPASGAAGIGTTMPHASSVMEVKSTTKGVLLPRMTAAQRAAIASPATGLLVYQTDGTTGFYYYAGGWKVLGPLSANTALSNLVATSINQSLLPSTNGSRDLGSSTNKWKNLFLTGNITSTSLNTTYASNISTQAPFYVAKRSRGTLTLPLAVAANDAISSIAAAGYDGSTFQTTASIDFFVDGVPSASNVPTSISFFTGSNPGNRIERLKIGSTGNFNFNNGQCFIQQATGNIGIGTTTPSGKLDIVDSAEDNGLLITKFYHQLYDKIGIGVGCVGFPGYGIGAKIAGGHFGVQAAAYGGDKNYIDEGIGVLATAASKAISQPYVPGYTGYTGTYIGLEAGGEFGAFNYGVYGFTLDPSQSKFNAAGFFSGDVYASNYYTVSDRKFKTNIVPINNSLSKIMKLKPSSYSFKKFDNLNQLGLPKGQQLGLIADELKEVYPELVQEAVKPAQYSKDGKKISEQEKYQTINYVGIIPVLVASLQEQQKQLEQLKKKNEKIEQLEARLSKLEALLLSNGNSNTQLAVSAAFLDQSIPNPSTGNTIIGYHLPHTTINAKLVITDAKGSMIKNINLTNTRNGQITLDNSALYAGTYSYTLYVDGKQVDSKQMVVIR